MTTSDFKNIAIGMLVVLAFFLYTKPQPAQQAGPVAVQPAAPAPCACGTTKQVTRPFNVVCPYCRATITIQPSATGEVGEAVGPQVK